VQHATEALLAADMLYQLLTCEPRLEAEELECAQETQNNVEKRPASCAQSDKETLKSDGAQEERGEKEKERGIKVLTT
jgi:hypothetical protein